jgi:(2Fe-2S) ferredoxin
MNYMTDRLWYYRKPLDYKGLLRILQEVINEENTIEKNIDDVKKQMEALFKKINNWKR